ncbi:MAG TPA: MFS transporter [Kofleriaceae bacterium]
MKLSPRALALALAPGTLLAGIAGGIVFPIFPIAGKEAHLSEWFIGVILAANRAARVVLAPVAGIMADRIGGRRTMLGGLVVQVFVIGLYLVGLVLHEEGAAFLGGRLLHGLGSACVFVAAQALSLQAATTNNRGAAVSAVRVAIVIGVPIGFVVGGLLAIAVGDVWTFAIAGVAVVVALAGATWTVPDLRAPVRRRATIRESIGAMRDKRLFAIGGLNFALSFAAGGMVLSTLAFLVEDRHLVLFGLAVQGTAGILMAVLSITDAMFTPVAGRLGDRFRGHALVASAGCVLTAAGLAVIGFAGGLGGSIVGIAIVGLGGAALGPSVLVLLGAIVPPELRGAGTGFLQLCGDLGGMLGPLVGTALFASSTTVPYLIAAGVVACFLPLALWLARLERAQNQEAAAGTAG